MTDLSIFLSTKSIIVFILVLTRLGGMIATAPLFSTFPLPMPVKVGLSALCAFIMYPLVMQSTSIDIPTDLFLMSALVLKELAIGILIGFSASLIFTGVQIAGHLLSIQMGLAMASALDPVTGIDLPIVGQFYLFIAGLVFIYIRGYQWLFSSIHESFLSLPLGMDFVFTGQMTEQLLYFFGNLFSIAFSIVMPIFSILLLVTLLMGFMSKIMPQMNIFMVAMPIKIYIGLGLVAMLMPPTTSFLMQHIKKLLIDLDGIFLLT